MAAALPWLAPACAAPGDAAHDTGSARRMGVSTSGLEPDIEIALAPPVSAPAPGSHPAAAFDGAQYFVVWNDYRALRSRLYGARMTADGTVLDPLGILLVDDVDHLSGPGYVPAISFDGTSHLVAFVLDGTVMGLRVRPDGAVLDASPFPISVPNLGASQPKLAFDGTNHLVVWSRYDDDDPARAGIFVARVRPDGTVLDAGGARVHAIAADHLDVAFDGENYFLSWRQYTPDQYTLMGARLTTTGTLLDPGGFRITEEAPLAVHAVGFDGTNHVVVWSTYDDERAREFLHATRVTPAGAVLEPAQIALGFFGAESSHFSRVAAAATSAGTIVASSREGIDDGGGYWEDIRLALVPVQGDAVLLPPESSPGIGVDVALATGTGGALALWTAGYQDQRAPFTPIAAMRLSANATSIDTEPVFVSTAASAQEVRAVASDGQGFFVLWTDARNPLDEGRSLYGARVSADGTALDPEAILVTQEEVDAVDVVFDGASYLVMFTRQQYEGSYDPVRAVRVSPEGQVLDATPVPLPLCSPTSDDRTPRAASAGDRTLLLATGCDVGVPPLAVVLLDRQGTPLGAPAAIVDDASGYEVLDAQVASDGAGFLVVWRDPERTLRGQRVDATGALVGEAFPIISLPIDAHWPGAVRFGNGAYHVVWSSKDGISGARVDADGQVLDPQGFPILAGETGLSFEGALAFHGDDLVVAYRQVVAHGDLSDYDVHAVEVSPTGGARSRLAISGAPEMEGPPVLAANDAQQVLAAYTRYVPEAPLSARQARARFLVEAPAPEPGSDAGPGAPDAGDPPGNPGDGEVGGCGCAATASPADAGALALLALGVLLAIRRRPRHDLSA
jgi:MYXO-CTERM domain-containing protein